MISLYGGLHARLHDVERCRGGDGKQSSTQPTDEREMLGPEAGLAAGAWRHCAINKNRELSLCSLSLSGTRARALSRISTRDAFRFE